MSYVGSEANNSVKMETKHGWTLRFRDDNSSTYVPQLTDK